MLKNTAALVRRNASETWNLFILPAFLAMLPWRYAYRGIRKLAFHASLFKEESDAAWKEASLFFPQREEGVWKHRYRIIRWVELVDTFLVLTRPSTWWHRTVELRGEFLPHSFAGVLLTYHWGAGFWLWKLLAPRGINAYFLAKPAQAGDHGHSRASFLYSLFRGRLLRRIGSLGPIYLGGSVDRLTDVLRSNLSVVGMLDLPTAKAKYSSAATVLGRSIRLPAGVLQLAAKSGTPVALLSCGLDFDTGRRFIRAEQLGIGTVESIMQSYARHLSERLIEAPEAWHMWHEAGAIFQETLREERDARLFMNAFPHSPD